MGDGQCEDYVEGRPLRVAGGFPCWRKAKATTTASTGHVLRVCGIHARVRARWGDAVVYDEPAR